MVLWLRIHLSMQEIQETRVQSLVRKIPLKGEMATHSSILAWKISWTEEPGGVATVYGDAELDTTEHTHSNGGDFLGQ